MSEKQVNIKITANTKDFNNAIDKAQKQIESLAEVIDKLSSSKFGEKLEEQFDGLVKAVKKIEEQMTDMMDSLDDLGKAKFDKIEDQFKDIIDSGKDVNEKIEDILDLLDKVDRQDLNGLEKEFDQVRDSLEQLSKETRESTDTMEKNFRDITDEVDKFIKELNNVEDTKLENLEESIKDLDKYVDEAAESVSDFNKKTDELDTKELNDYIDYLKDVEAISEDVGSVLKKVFGAFGDANGKFNFDLSGKGKDGGFISTLAEGLVSGTVAGNKLEKAMEGVADSISDVAKSTEKLNDSLNTDSIDELGKEYKEAENAMEKLTKEYDDLIKKQEELTKSQEEFKNSNDLTNKAITLAEEKMYEYAEQAKELDKAIEKAREAQEEYAEDSTKLEAQLSAITDRMEEQKEVVDQLGKEYDKAVEEVNRYAKASEYVNKLAEEGIDKNTGVRFTDGNYTIAWSSLEHALKAVNDQLEKAKRNAAELGDELSKENNSLNALEEAKKSTEEQRKALEENYKAIGKTEEEIEEMTKAWQDANKKAEEFQDLMTKLRQTDIDEAINMEFIKENFKETTEAAEKLKKQMKETAEAMAEMNKVAQGHADDFDKQYEAYEKLSKEVKEYLKNEENGILLREKVAKSFKQVADSMEAVYAGASKHNNADLITETLQEAAKYVKELDLVSTENLQADLNRLGEIIEDKTEKIKRFKELNKEFGSDASKDAAGIDKRAKAIRDWANSTDFAIEAADKLTNAWGDLSAAGEDHLKIRERAKYIEDFGEALEKNVAQIRNNHKELKTLDEIYEKCTDKERGVLEDYKMWEKNKDALLEYNRAINEYLRTLKDTGGEIDSKFLNELGKFDPQKFIDNFEKMGASSVVLSKQINAVKIELLESIKQYKENAEAAKENAEQSIRNAETALEEAKANKKKADSQEEYKEAVEQVKKAQQELADAKKNAKNYDEDTLKTLKEQIQEYNRLAAAMREIGMAAQDLGKADIAKFNKSLASMLDNLGTFENDLPKTFADIKEDIKALFMDMDSLDFGGIFDGLKDIGAGVLGKLPTELKVAATAAVALGVALKECAEIGINQFTRGMETVGNALSSIMGVARDVGQEIRDAFENITGMQMDFSSLIEIPVNFESQIAKVGAIAGVDRLSEQFKELEALARELGATTRYSATEVAQAMEYMAMAGWEFEDMTRESKDGVSALESVLSLATVASMDLGQASDFVTDGLTALGYEAEDAAKFVDILAAASTSSNTSVAQMQRAFTNCAPVAGTLGITMEDLSIALGLIADKGIKGAKAGTALKNLMANLSAPTEKQLAYIKKFNLEGAQQAIVNGDLISGIKQMKAALAGLSPQQQNAVITTIAGKEALSGISALLNTTEGDMAKLEAAIRDCDGAAKAMAEDFDKTVKGSLLKLASAMQERLLQVFDKTKDSIMKVTDQLAEFFNIWNGMPQLDETQGLTGLADALAYLEEISRGWGDAIADGLANAINSIDNFLNSKSFDNLLQVGTNIINGIADGIREAADDGSLDSAISTAIGKIADWFSENLETIIDVGKEIIDAISNGISENGDAIGEAIKAVMELQTEIDKAVAKEKWKLIGSNLVSFISEGIVSKVSVFVAGVEGFFSGSLDLIGDCIEDLFLNKLSPMIFDPIATLGEIIGNFLQETIIGAIERGFDVDLSFLDGFNILNPTTWFGDKNNKKKSSKKTNSKGSSKAPTVDTSSSPIDIINSNLSSGKSKTDATAASIGEGISSNITSKLETMDAAGLQALNTEMKSLQTTVTALGQGMSASFTVIQDSARTAFMNFTNIVRNQMLNCTNIIRNQCVNWYNIINNQVTNARNALTSQFLSMAAVARTQMVNISNIIRNQAVTWTNIISNQVKNARDALTRQFMSMAAVARTQMNKVASAVSSSMGKVAASASKGVSMNVNVNRNVSTGYAMPSANALYAANAGATFSLGNNMSAFANNASYAAPSGNSGTSSSDSAGGGMVIEVPLYLDGKVVARATARYVDNELKQMTKRENRKRGAK